MEVVFSENASGTDPGKRKATTNRGSYVCGICGLPKKGHRCPYKICYRIPKSFDSQSTECAQSQVDLGSSRVSDLNLASQGSEYSY